ncbi:ABC transporter substrate-binding protein [Azospirillum sp.]|uniref:ABC transporter substrate-binding protein n=1 Tax=Azospirillum sp. TaxID=34012 RepID=UPI002D2C175E|nr:ABC transporter substrate-binding protein [Azospirillum sp.]HYD67310.1 ABC transporter substrate-binding protein [Azospirillum sp.]
MRLLRSATRGAMRGPLAAVAACVLSLSLAGAARAQTDAAAAALVPKPVRDAGTLRVGSQQTFPPVEFRMDGKTEPVGVSVDLLNEIGKRLGLTITFVHGEYAALIPGLEAGRFDVASGGISDTEEREQKVDFVNYMVSGGSILVRAADAPKYSTLADFCGKSVATLLGSRVIMAAVEKASEACTAGGKGAITANQLPAAPDARMQLDLGRVDGYLGDFPALVYMKSQMPGKYAIAGENHILTPYITSWGFPKTSTLKDAVQKAAQGMLADGSYKAILAKWNLEGGALPEITINLPASKRK